ncbi:MAG: Hpt domain-containing protein, partial [Oscillospiraceae bacterium]|nr:Hpt domain-containing protein [Oscillospiraceae bacterium]
MGSGNEILDMYIYETTSLLEQLETIILEAEKVDTFSQENVNEIFRVMHTIKGSSAMMEFDTLATVAHRIEDMFFIIREGTMSVVSEENRPALFDVVFQSIDFFRGEVEKVEAGEPLDKNIDSFLSNINTLIAKIKGEDVPEEATAPAASSTPAAQAASSPAAPAAADGFPDGMRVNFEEGCGMASRRAG